MIENKHWGSTLDSFLKEQGIYEEVTASAVKAVENLGGFEKIGLAINHRYTTKEGETTIAARLRRGLELFDHRRMRRDIEKIRMRGAELG